MLQCRNRVVQRQVAVRVAQSWSLIPGYSHKKMSNLISKSSHSDEKSDNINLNEWKNKVVVIAGATNVGKSAAALELCNILKDVEIVVADSVQAYKHLDIGSNKPTEEEQLSYPHHMLDMCDPVHTISTGEYSRKAAAEIHKIIERNKIPSKFNLLEYLLLIFTQY